MLVPVGINANARYEWDPDRLILRSGQVEAVEFDPGKPLAIYIESSAFLDFDVSPSDRYCTARSPDLDITIATGRIRYARVDGITTWMRVAYLEAPTAGTYDLECIEYQSRQYAIAAAVPGSRAGRVMAAGIVLAGLALILGVPLIAIGVAARRSHLRGKPAIHTLFRPTGEAEIALVAQSGFRAWPPRLPEQPIFYPVTNEEYATQIASQWNASAEAVGYVTEFDVESRYLEQFQPQVVGDGSVHVEYWIPADRLEEFNSHIVGKIRVIRAFRGDPPVEVPVDLV